MVNSMNTRQIAEHRAGNASTKAALQVATQYLSREMGAKGIHINTVVPGWMWGPSVERHLEELAVKEGTTSERLRERIEEKMMIPKMPTDKECAMAIIALASDYFTCANGACLDINGGAYVPLF